MYINNVSFFLLGLVHAVGAVAPLGSGVLQPWHHNVHLSDVSIRH